MRYSFALIALLAVSIGCSRSGGDALTREEKALISGSGPVMRVLTVDDPSDSIFLRGKSFVFSANRHLKE